MKYSWAYKDLKKRYNLLERKFQGNLSFEDRILIITDMKEILKSIRFLVPDKDLSETPTMVDMIAAERELLSRYNFLWNDCIKMADSIERKISMKLSSQKLILTQDELLGIST